MTALTGADELFLHLESPTRPLHTLKIGICEVEGDFRFEEMRELLERRLDRLPPFRWRLAPAPLRFGRARWIEDPDFDLDRHLRRVTLDPPGGRRELCAAISDLAAGGVLPRDRPLWEWWVVEGLQGGRFASVVKQHHAMADGVSSARLLMSFFAEGRPPVPRPAAARLSAARALADGAERAAAYAGELGRTVAKTAAALRKRRSLDSAARAAPVPPGDVPATTFNRRLGPRRVFACSSLPMEAVLARKRAHSATVNDVFLAAVAGGVRRYLRARDSLPPEPLVARVPVSTLAPEKHGYFGNRGLRSMYARLPTDLDDPAARIGAAHEGAVAAKARLEALNGGREDDWLAVLPGPALRGLLPLLDPARPPNHPRAGNLVVSNVRGPADPLEADGYRLVEFYSIGPCLPGSGLNLTAWSFAGDFNISAIADPEIVPDLWELLEGIRAELDQPG